MFSLFELVWNLENMTIMVVVGLIENLRHLNTNGHERRKKVKGGCR